MNILVVFTGGTIGCQRAENGWLSPEKSHKSVLISEYILRFKDDIIFDELYPYTILSENLSGKELNILIKTIENNLNDKYDGIIVTHGTDSIQYTSAALTYAFCNVNIPIVLVSSNYPLDDDRANGFINFEAAVSFIKEGKYDGVYVSYKNREAEETSIHYGTRLIKHQEMQDALYSLMDIPFAYYKNNEIVHNEKFKIYGEINSIPNVKFTESNDILVINSYPGDSFNYNIKSYKAIILNPYHSGTLNTANESFINFCYCAKKKNIPIFVVNLCQGFEYESKKTFDNLNLIQLPTCSFSSIYVKLWIGLSVEETDIIEFIKKPLVGEFSE